MYKVNVLGPLMLTQALAGVLVSRGGCVVNIGSVGVSGLPFHGAYASSKVCWEIYSTLPLETLLMRVVIGCLSGVE